jgi:radical SAM superfamily enzyme YgiQ (UPF0313 family)
MSTLHVAAFIDRGKYDVRLHHEMYHGEFRPADSEQYDVVFLTGLQKDFDRMRQLSYYFRQGGAVTVAGGNVCSMFPDFAARFFDAVCAGSIDATAAVLRDLEQGQLQRIYRHPPERITAYRVAPRLLADSGIRSQVHFIEASRVCNFKCDFCVISAEQARHATYDVDTVMQAIRDSIDAAPALTMQRLYPVVWFLDNNFANDLRHLRAICAAVKADPRVKLWGAMVTQDVLRNHELVRMMADSKCAILFSGVESFDVKVLKRHDKRQNVTGQEGLIADIEFAASHGIHVLYGYLFDSRLTSIEEFKRELATILESDVLMYPNYVSMMTPLLGTRLFWDSARKRDLLPRLWLRDLDGETLAFGHTRDTLLQLSAFAQVLYRGPEKLAGRTRLLRKLVRYLFRFRVFNPVVWYVLYRNNFRTILQAKGYSRGRRSYIGGSDILDPGYSRYPERISDTDRRTYFDPIVVSDEHGGAAEWLRPYDPFSEDVAEVAPDRVAATTHTVVQ